MSHRHFCDVAGHWWICDGRALRVGDREPSVCTCLPCGLPLEGFDHRQCHDPVELLAYPEHGEEEYRRMEQSRKELERRAAEFGLEPKLAKLQALPESPEKHALAQEIVTWLCGEEGDIPEP